MKQLNAPLKLTVTFKSTSPLHISDATSGFSVVTEDGYIRTGKIPGLTPITRTERKPVLIRNENDEEVVGYFPYIKANNLVGRLRRKAHDVISELYIERGLTMHEKVYRGLSCGASSGSPSGDQASMDDYIHAGNNLVLGLFGGGDSIFPSGMSLSDANPVHHSLIESGVVDDALSSLATNINPLKMTYPSSLIRKDRMSDYDDINLPAVVDGGISTVDNWIKQVSDSKSEATRVMLKNKVAYEVTLTGLTYASGITLKPSASDYHVGLLLECLSRMAKDNGLGGKVSKGLGQFNMSVMIDGEPVIQSDNGQVNVIGGDEYFDALVEALDNFDTDELERFFK